MLFLTLGDTADTNKFSQRIASLRNLTSIIDQEVTNPDARIILEQIKNRTGDLESTGQSLIDAYKSESGAAEGFNFSRHAEEIRNLNKFSSEIREAGVKLADLETKQKAEQEKKAKEAAAVFYNIIFAISAIAFIAAIILGYFISESISRPIKKLKDVAAEVGSGNLDAEVKSTSKDEIGELAASFNKMVGDLKRSKKEMEDYNKQLEKKVEEKTANIRKSKAVLEDYNKQLETEVKKRTGDLEESKKRLEEKVKEFERINKLSVGRELRMIELKKRIQELEKSGK